MKPEQRPKIENLRNLEVIGETRFMNRVSVVTYTDGWKEIYVDDLEIGTPSVAIGVAEALLKAARRAKMPELTEEEKNSPSFKELSARVRSAYWDTIEA